MTSAELTACVWTSAWVAALLLAESRHSQRGVWIAKPLASLGFLAAAWAASAHESSYGQTVMLGLVACALGDVLLVPRGAGGAFLAGMASFALGHAAYAVAFARGGVDSRAAWIALAAMAATAAITLRWLGARLPAAMQLPIRGYAAVISMMVTLAVGASGRSGEWTIAAGAVLFAASDLSVARERFVRPAFVNLLWGLPLYYAAQLLLALAV
jgi:uncharacterized membrane protein YhhN